MSCKQFTTLLVKSNAVVVCTTSFYSGE